MAGVCRAGACWSASGIWTPATGARICPAGRSSNTICCGSSGGQLMAIFLQVISARLGVATGKDLAQCCRDWYPKWTRWPNWLLCELAIGACDLAEALGSAVAINLLFHIPLLLGGDHHRRGCAACCWRCSDTGCGRSRRWCSCWSPRLRSAISSRFSSFPQTQPSFLEMGHAMLHAGSPRSRLANGMAFTGDRDHRRDGDAA
jgi:hypothetical protein